MSILDNQAEIDEAKARLGAKPDDELERDLTYWTMTELDHHGEWTALNEKVVVTARLHAEAQRWSALIASELHRRLVEKRAKARG